MAPFSDLGEGLIQMIEGLADFGELGQVEHLAFGGYASESWPLGAELGAELVVEGQDGGFDPGEYDDSSPATAPDYSDIPATETANQEELAQILMQRRQAIADAIKQRDLQTQKVTDLDHQIVDILNPQYQQALGANDQEAAIRLGGQIRVLNLQRAEAVQKALDWARFQVTAAQLAKNVRAQLALQQLFYQTQQSDPATATEIARAYQEIGQATAAIKAAREQAKAQQSLMVQQQVLQTSSDALTKAQQLYTVKQAKLRALRLQLDKMLLGRDEYKLAPSSKARVDKVRANIETASGELVAAQQAYADQAAAMRQTTTTVMTPAPAVALQGFGDSAAMCTLYTRDKYGPTCMEASELNLGDLGDSGVARIMTDIFTGGAAEMAWNEKARSGLDQETDKIGKKAGWIARNITCPVAKNLQVQGVTGGTNVPSAGMFATSAIVGLCETPGRVVAVSTPVLTRHKAWYEEMGIVLPLALVAGGIAGGLYLATKKKEAPRLQGLGRMRRVRRRQRRR